MIKQKLLWVSRYIDMISMIIGYLYLELSSKVELFGSLFDLHCHFFLLAFCDMMSWRYRFNPFHTIHAVKKKTQFHIVSMAPGGKWLQWPLWKAFHRACSWWVDSRRPKGKKTWANLNTVLVLDDVQIPLSLGIQSYSQMMIGVSNHLLSIVFRFHEAILRFGESGFLGYTTCYWIDILYILINKPKNWNLFLQQMHSLKLMVRPWK